MLFKLRLMKKKLFILIMSSALVSGTVANADTASFNDPQDIYIEGIFENDYSDSSSSAGSAVTAMTPFGPGDVPEVASENLYRLKVEVVNFNGGLLDQVAACIYDASVLTSSELIDEACGTGLETPYPPNLNSDRTAAIKPQSAIQMFYLTDRDNTLSEGQRIQSAAPTIPAESDPNSDANTKFAHKVFSSDNTYGSYFEIENSFAGVEGTQARHIQFLFAPASIANKSSLWKIRVTAEYADSPVVEVTDDGPYTMNFFGGITDIEDDQRPTIDYGTLSPGDFSDENGIRTGEYVSNATAQITLAAGAFGKEGSNNLTFVSETPGDGDVKFECGPTGNLSTLVEQQAIVMFDAQPANSVQTSPWLRQDIDDHDCKLTYGSGADSGQYSNDMTVAVTE